MAIRASRWRGSVFGGGRIAFLVDASTLGEAIYLLAYQGSFPLCDPAFPLVWLGAVHLFICPFDKLLRILFRGKLASVAFEATMC